MFNLFAYKLCHLYWKQTPRNHFHDELSASMGRLLLWAMAIGLALLQYYKQDKYYVQTVTLQTQLFGNK